MKKFLTIVSCLVLTLIATITLAGCGHKCEFSEEWTAGELTHYHACLDEKCTKIADETAHNFSLKVESESYLSQSATNSTNAVYFYSCECGAKGTETFEVQKQELVLDLSNIEVVAKHNKTYDAFYVPAITAESLGLQEGTTVRTYYKAKDALDTEYSSTRVEDAGVYTCKIEVNETIENKAYVTYFDFEISPIVVNLNPNVTYVSYSGDNSQLIAPSNYHYPSILKGDGNITCTATFASKDVGVYSIEEGTLTVESYWGNPNYVFKGSIEIRPRDIISMHGVIKITLEEGKTLYTIDLEEQGIVSKGDDVKAGVLIVGETPKAGTYDLYWKYPASKGIYLALAKDALSGQGIFGEDAKNYNFVCNSYTPYYYINVEIIVPA